MGVHDFHLPLDFFEHLTFAEFCDVSHRHSISQEREQFFYGQICEHIRWAVGAKEPRIYDLLAGLDLATPAAPGATPEDGDDPQTAMERRLIAGFAAMGIQAVVEPPEE